MNPGADRENTTIMAAVSASGRKLPPMIIFEGAHVQTTWRPEILKNSPNYPWLYANKSGWMDSETFYRWFEEWEKQTRSFEDNVLEPRLLIYDGHLSHLWYGTIELAREKKVSIIKLPAHTTDLLQPLDVSVFKALKNYWGDVLFKRLKTTRSHLTKAEFASNLCSPECWDMAFSTKNIENGFIGCGIYPCDREKYPKSRFHPHLLQRYEKWIEEGKPEISAAEIDDMISIARQEDKDADEECNLAAPGPSTPTSDSLTVDGKKGKVISFFVPEDDPASITRIDTPTLTTPESSKRTFQQMALKTIEDLHNSSNSSSKKEVTKRRKVNQDSELVTSDQKFEKILNEEKEKEAKKREKEAKKKEKEEKKKEKEAEKMERGDRKGKRKQVKNKENEEPNTNKPKRKVDSDTEMEDSDGYNTDTSIRPEHVDDSLFPPQDDLDGYKYLLEVWDELNPPVEEKDLQGKIFGVIYNDKNDKPHFFIGKIIARYLYDEDGPAKEFQVEVFKKAATSTSTILEETPTHLKDIANYPAHNIICGPLQASLLTGATGRTSGRWSVPQYPLALETFNIVKDLERKDEYERYFPFL